MNSIKRPNRARKETLFKNLCIPTTNKGLCAVTNHNKDKDLLYCVQLNFGWLVPQVNIMRGLPIEGF